MLGVLLQPWDTHFCEVWLSSPGLLQALHWIEEGLQWKHALRKHPQIWDQNSDKSDFLLPVPMWTSSSPVVLIILAPMAVQWPAVNKKSGVKKQARHINSLERASNKSWRNLYVCVFLQLYASSPAWHAAMAILILVINGLLGKIPRILHMLFLEVSKFPTSV